MAASFEETPASFTKVAILSQRPRIRLIASLTSSVQIVNRPAIKPAPTQPKIKQNPQVLLFAATKRDLMATTKRRQVISITNPASSSSHENAVLITSTPWYPISVVFKGPPKPHNGEFRASGMHIGYATGDRIVVVIASSTDALRAVFAIEAPDDSDPAAMQSYLRLHNEPASPPEQR